LIVNAISVHATKGCDVTCWSSNPNRHGHSGRSLES
jgi:hypothetical protein